MSAPKETASPSAPASTTTRRAALAAALAIPLAAEPAAGSDATAALIARAAEKNAAFMRGDMQRWAELVRFAPDFTLMQPFGGPVSHGFDKSPYLLAEMSRYFRNGKTQLEVAQTYSSNDLLVLVMIAVGDRSGGICLAKAEAGQPWQVTRSSRGRCGPLDTSHLRATRRAKANFSGCRRCRAFSGTRCRGRASATVAARPPATRACRGGCVPCHPGRRPAWHTCRRPPP